MKNSLLAAGMLFLGLAGAVAAAPKLGTDKYHYLPFQPVYLKIEGTGQDNGGRGIDILEKQNNTLTITYPDGEKRDYRPLITACDISGRKSDSRVVYATLILSGGNLITEKPGLYELELDGDPSTRSTFEVVSARKKSDIDALAQIRKNPLSYAQFVYLEGGEHFHEGLEIHKALATSQSDYATAAKAILAINYTQSFSHHGVKDGKARPKDIEAVDRYAPKDGEGIPEYLRIRMASMISSSFEDNKIPILLREQILLVKKELDAKGSLMEFYRKQIR